MNPRDASTLLRLTCQHANVYTDGLYWGTIHSFGTIFRESTHETVKGHKTLLFFFFAFSSSVQCTIHPWVFSSRSPSKFHFTHTYPSLNTPWFSEMCVRTEREMSMMTLSLSPGPGGERSWCWFFIAVGCVISVAGIPQQVVVLFMMNMLTRFQDQLMREVKV